MKGMVDLMIMPKYIHPTWNPFLTEDVLKEIKLIESNLGSDFTPSNPDKILRFLSANLEKVKVIWLGQDVYPSKEKATGRAFEVGDLQDWTDSFRQTSLKNIIRLINKNYYGIENYKEIKKFSQIKEEIKSNKFDLKPPHNWFESLEEQGVLFLNTSFTCEIGVPNSHRGLWSKFSQQVLEFISVNRPDIVWFLWGKEAISNKKYINNGVFYESRHPSRVSESYKDDFLKFEGFKETMEIINWLG